MKVVHVSTFDTGGAAIAAARLHKGLLLEGIGSSFISLFVSNKIGFPNKFEFKQKGSSSVLKRVKGKFGISVSQADRNRDLIKGRKGNFELFSFPFTDYCVEDHPLIQEADIVHLHWVSNFINYETFFKSIKKP